MKSFSGKQHVKNYYGSDKRWKHERSGTQIKNTKKGNEQTEKDNPKNDVTLWEC